ncbi:TPA: TetR/AcrR family transcriptional regulator [Burkholderia cenocepacia]|nr:TetR family transcriptional regulator [Burkholderia cenocepacia]MBR8155360.1 TetR/AcrR family transcriptional regulator [Burkholderia cenocepacia]MBR8398734.1 TetR/AcrR family transcriptional regulator [Burkholderia cenocepacia]MBR8412823.1 TetR/AcrR family transcriptional regulator [Burkholderia cenocepacia]HDR9802987.1 TetR/AcrR family transcriptional regulator [Burkholderia cenocepacia]
MENAARIGYSRWRSVRHGASIRRSRNAIFTTNTMTVSNEQRSTRKRRTSTATAAASNTDGLRAQGLRTRNTIIRVARKLLLEGGPLEFSQRAVAAAAGISVSNLQYYFPTRIAVLRAVIEPVIEAYLDDMKRAISRDASPRDVFEEIIVRSIADAKDAKYNALFRHFLSFAATDAECLKLCEEWYSALTRDLTQLVRALTPTFSAADSRHAATMLIALADGLAMQYGTIGRHTQALDAYFAATSRAIAYGTLTAPAVK